LGRPPGTHDLPIFILIDKDRNGQILNYVPVVILAIPQILRGILLRLTKNSILGYSENIRFPNIRIDPGSAGKNQKCEKD
jgi:hypothetical protein